MASATPAALRQLEVQADDRELSAVRDFVAAACAEFGFSPRTLANIRLAVDEACTNVVKHAYGDSSGTLRIGIETRRGWLEIRILDTGKPFDGRVEIPHLGQLVDTKRRGGLGVFLMSRLMDDVRYQTTPAGNEWLLRKRLPAPASEFTRRIRRRYGMRAAAGLVLLTALVVAAPWIQEGREQNHAEEARLVARAFGLAEAARSVLLQRAELSPEQTHLFEAVHTLVAQEPRLVAVSVVDRDGTIWAADRAAATFTRFVPPQGLGSPDSHGLRRAHERVEGERILHLLLPVRLGGGKNLGDVHLAVRWGATEAAIRRSRMRLVAGAFAVDALGLVLLALFMAHLLRPLQRLVDGVRNAGTSGTELAVDGPEEIGAIAAAFNEIHARYRVAQESAAEHARLQEEMQVAREIQAGILPQSVPQIPGYEIARLYRPAQEVGGDYYDFLDAGAGLTGVVVADVAGKGVPGSIVMSMIRTALRMETRSNAHAGDVLARLHAFISADMRKGMFVTMLYVVLDERNRVISYASAGHTPMLLYRASSDETFFLSPRGIPVGLAGSDSQTFEKNLDVERLRLHPGDMLLLYTDGISEACNAAGEAYGEQRLVQALKRWGSNSADAFVQHLEQDLLAFTGSENLQDDLTLVAIRELQGAPVAQGELQARLVDLIENQHVPVEVACRKLKISPSTYYRFKRRESRDEVALQQLSVEKRAQLERLVAAHPELDPRQLTEMLRAPEWGGIEVPATLVHAELRRLGLLEEPARRQHVAAPAWLAAPTVAAPSIAAPPAAVAPRFASVEPAPPNVDDADLFVEQGGLRGLVERPASDAGSDCAVVLLEGCADSGSCTALEQLLATAATLSPRVVVDLGPLAYVSSRGWGLLAALAARLRPSGGLVLCGMRRETYDVFKMLGFETVIPSAIDRATAAAMLSTANGTPPAPLPQPIAALVAPLVPAPPVFIAAAETQEPEVEWESLRVRIGAAGPGGQVTLVALSGVLDTVSAHRLETALSGLVANGARHLLVDLASVEFVSSAGWGTFTASLPVLRRDGGDLRLFGMSEPVGRIFALLHLQVVLQSFDVLAEALASFQLSGAVSAPDEDAVATSETLRSATAADPELVSSDTFTAGDLHARLEPFGNTGCAARLRLSGAWGRDAAARTCTWLEGRETSSLLLVDAIELCSAEPAAWEALQRVAVAAQADGRVVRVVAPAVGLAPGPELGLPVHANLAEALRAHQEFDALVLGTVRLPHGEFDKDAEVRAEGWNEYVELLRSALTEESL